MNPTHTHRIFYTGGQVTKTAARSAHEFGVAADFTTELTSEPTAQSVRAERAEALERERITDALDEYGDSDPGDDGDILTFVREVPTKGLRTYSTRRPTAAELDAAEGDDGEGLTTLHYAFIRSGGRYFGTGRCTPNGVDYATLVNWLIDLGIAPNEVGGISVDDADSSTLNEWV